MEIAEAWKIRMATSDKQGGIEADGNDPRAPSTEEEKSQTRFTFYNSESTNDQESKEEKNEDPRVSKRFNFYNAEEVNIAASLNGSDTLLDDEPETPQKNKEIDQDDNRESVGGGSDAGGSEVGGSDVGTSVAVFEAPLSDTQDVSHTLTTDSNEILRSLQETERQRGMTNTVGVQRHQNNGQTHMNGQREPTATQLSGSSDRNPYEAAIKDALNLLRRSRANNASPKETGGVLDLQNRDDDQILQAREEVDSDHHEAVVRGRQERMEKYASRLAELKLKGDDISSTANLESPADGKRPSYEKLMRRTHLGDDVRPNGDQSTSHDATRGEEVQDGVERVLMAILQRAHSKSRAGREGIPHANNDDLIDALGSLFEPNAHSRAIPEPVDIVSSESDGGDLHPSPSDGTSNTEGQLFVKTDESSLAASSVKRSVVEELLAEDEGADIQPQKEKGAVTLPTPSSTMVELHASPQSNVSKITADPCVAGENNQGDSETDSTEDGLEEDEDYEQDHEDEDDDHEDEDNEDEDEDISEEIMDEEEDEPEAHDVGGDTRVLGPLSRGDGGTTGVVLETEGSNLEEEQSNAASSILESLSTAVKDAESFVSYMTNAMTLDETKKKLKDRYEPEEAEEESDEDDGSYDADANELMRSLCAHLLPFGVDKSTKHLSEIPPWDNTNVNEPGYRIIRLSKAQLLRVEREFERMVNGVKRHSERDLGKKKKLGQADADQDWNMTNETDPTFERDLEEAEDLLDREEKRQEAYDRARKDVESSKPKKAPKTVEQSRKQSPKVEQDADEAVVCHPSFPGVKGSGEGEMGDLEFFHLPIIYKSHVTGFEPTKDLYLEPGNVVAGQYLVENELGSAAFSTAYRCVDLNSELHCEGDYHEEVCLKVIKNTKDFFDQSLDEIKILELLRQTGQCEENNIVEMKTFFYYREHLVIVTELLRQNLFEFGKFIIENNEEAYFTRKRLCYITRQVLIALDFVHKLGLVHSDIKPENILLASYSRARVKVIDFGSSCYLTDRQSSYIQSRSYRAPEVVLGLPYDGKIDMWSLGCVVAEMYTGEVTFQNDSIVSMLSRIEAICGPFPRHMIAQGRQAGRFFTKSGLLYELVDGEERRTNPLQDDDVNGLFDVFQPKRTTLAARLGFDPDVVQERASPEAQDQALFVDFCKSLLTIDPDARPSAETALQHPWILLAETMTEQDVKYPSQ